MGGGQPEAGVLIGQAPLPLPGPILLPVAVAAATVAAAAAAAATLTTPESGGGDGNESLRKEGAETGGKNGAAQRGHRGEERGMREVRKIARGEEAGDGRSGRGGARGRGRRTGGRGEERGRGGDLTKKKRRRIGKEQKGEEQNMKTSGWAREKTMLLVMSEKRWLKKEEVM